MIVVSGISLLKTALRHARVCRPPTAGDTLSTSNTDMLYNVVLEWGLCCSTHVGDAAASCVYDLLRCGVVTCLFWCTTKPVHV